MRKGIMLCIPYEERRLTNPKFGWDFPLIVQPKLDGVRAVWKENELVSSEGNVLVLPEISEELRKNSIIDILDGEIYSSQLNFDSISGIARSKTNLWEKEQVNFVVFDIIMESEQIERLKRLVEIFEDYTFKCIQMCPFKFVDNLEQIYATLEEYIQAGYEGIIIRDFNNLYTLKRSNRVMKFKPRKDDVYKVISVIPAKSQIQPAFAGAFECTDQEGNHFLVSSSGLTQREKEYYLQNIPKFVRVVYQSKREGILRFGYVVQGLNNYDWVESSPLDIDVI